MSECEPSTCEAVGGLQHQKNTVSPNKDPFSSLPNACSSRSLLHSEVTKQHSQGDVPACFLLPELLPSTT